MNDAGQQRKPRPTGGDKGTDTDTEVVQVDPGSTDEMQRKLKEAADQLAQEKARKRAAARRRSCCCC